ncbi:MAG: presqualene diphosphate synthase HpnD [Rhodothalassiaceae bacterium]
MAATAHAAPTVGPEPGDREQVAQLVQQAGTSFYWAMRLLPQARREAMFGVYAFCREVDDIADGDARVADPAAALDSWRDRIAAIMAGDPQAHPLDRVLAADAVTYGLKEADFLAVIDGMAMDAAGPIIAPSQQDLDLYCDRVASAVGRLSVPIFGEPGEKGRRVATHLGRALQLTNILRDVHEDALIGRLYLPAELLDKHGVHMRDPRAVARHPAMPAVGRDLGQMAAKAFDRADTAIAQCDPRAMKPAVMMRAVYRRLLDKMAAQNFTRTGLPARRDPVTKARKVARRLLIAARYGLAG